MKKYVIPIIVITIIILILSGSYYIYSSNNSQDSIESLKSKADEEIKYYHLSILVSGNGKISFNGERMINPAQKRMKLKG